MSKTKIWLITAAFLVLVGSIIFGSVMTVLKWDFTKLSTNKYENNNYEITEDFNGISLKTGTADITFVISGDSKCSVECYEQTNAPHSVTVKDNALVIEAIDSRKWYEYIGINFDTPKIKVNLPKTEYTTLFIKESTGDIEIPKSFKFEDVDISLSTGDVSFFASSSKLIKIKTSTGKIHIENISAGALELSASTGGITLSDVMCEGNVNIKVSTGKTDLTDIKCKNLTSNASTGKIFLNNVIAAEKFSIKRSTGNVKFEKCDASEIFVETDTGNVVGSLLTDKVFITHTDTGSIKVPNSITGGRCEITTDTGNIEIDINS
ncbi:MAG: DUF4097 domain-containing protein [Ruminococcaceae bacterium]|nr:DUF4097 domain-containing protein [Oscillospiraceae bacterium]